MRIFKFYTLDSVYSSKDCFLDKVYYILLILLSSYVDSFSKDKFWFSIVSSYF